MSKASEHKKQKDKAESCDESEAEIISKIEVEEVKTEEIDDHSEITFTDHELTLSHEIKNEESESADYDSEATISADEFESLHEIEQPDDPLVIRLIRIPVVKQTLDMNPPTDLKPQPDLKSPPALKPPSHGLKPPPARLKPPPAGLKPPPTGLKPPLPGLKPPPPGLKPPPPALIPPPPDTPPSTLPTLKSKRRKKQQKNYICGYCHKSYISPGQIEKHMEISHGNLPPETCEICKKTVKNKYSLQIHMYNLHKRKNVYCEVCEKYFTKTKYQSHLKYSLNHRTKEEVYSDSVQCPVCNKMYKTEKHLERHIRYVHKKNNSEVYCRPCNKWFKSATYKVHIECTLTHISDDKKRYICDYCSSKFVFKTHLRDHILVVHLKRNPYKCPHCPMEFKNHTSRGRHVRLVHEKRSYEKKYICEVCGKAWQNPCLLRKHMPTHTGERPYKCGKCDATFGHKSALFLHNRYKHEKMKCPPKKKKNATKTK